MYVYRPLFSVIQLACLKTTNTQKCMARVQKNFSVLMHRNVARLVVPFLVFLLTLENEDCLFVIVFLMANKKI